ncbi:hypothetical protein C1H46_017110 [Malus baccata]|uniref:Uncharacterized protein n=1 Tax=Malus baccata TaxID=106549 RepID=A0A540MFT7_MALBA|nr:hypothetical protein C1H46_017110 [Malus baccata]
MILFGFYVFFKYGSGILDGQERIAVASMSMMRLKLVMKSIVPVVMTGLLGGIKVDVDRDESSHMLSCLLQMFALGLMPAACSGRMEF